MTIRVYVVGTDTSVGKTTLLEHLLGQARARGVAVLPFKPAQSGAAPHDPASDAARLAAAAGLPDPSAICPLWFAEPVAPGVAASPGHAASDGDASFVAAALARAIDEHAPQLVLLEGAGGLLVPMPAQSWQPEWIARLADHVVVVARAGLGTINHTLLTVEALRARGLEPVGIYLSEAAPPDASNPTNAVVIARATALSVLGTIPHGGVDVPDLLGPLLDAIAP